MNKYRLLKLKSGEQIITRIKSIKNNKLIIERPMVLKSLMVTDPFGRPKEITVLKNWLMYAIQEQTNIPKDFVASFLKPDDDIMKLYIHEKKKDDYDRKHAKSKIIKENDDFNLDDKKEITDIVEFFKNHKIKESDMDEIMQNIMNDINELNDDDFNELSINNSNSSEEFQNLITITMMIPPEALMIFVENGLLDIEDLESLINSLNNKPNKKTTNYTNQDIWKQLNLFNNLPNFNWSKKEPEEFGNSWKDWSPDPNDYLDDSK